MPLLPLTAAKSQKRQGHSAGKAGEPPPPPQISTLQLARIDFGAGKRPGFNHAHNFEALLPARI